MKLLGNVEHGEHMKEFHMDALTPLISMEEVERRREKNWLRPWKCTKCRCAFETDILLYRHLSFHLPELKPEERVQCEICGELVNAGKEHYSHMLKHKGKKFACDQCGEAFYHEFKYLRHLEYHKEKDMAARSTTVFQCGACDELFKFKSGLLYHLKREHTNKLPNPRYRKQQCKHCDEVLTGRDRLAIHMYTCHKEHYTGAIYNCEFCDTIFAAEDRRNMHTTVHTGLPAFSCKVCGKAFCNKPDLITHGKIAHARKNYRLICVICDEKFGSWQERQEHEKTEAHVQRCKDLGLTLNVIPPALADHSEYTAAVRINGLRPT